MNRRTFIIGSIAGAAALSAGGITWLSIDPASEPLTIAHSIQKLDNLIKANPTTTGEWNLYQVLTHCAQSVEYSISGYPEHKPGIFKNTVGKAAFSAFSIKGRMRHGLNEIIPGAPGFLKEENLEQAYNRFRTSLLDFDAHQGPLKQHFAYGTLSKAEYEKAHAMHFNNHLSEIVLAG